MRPHARIDANQPEIVKALRAAGASVQSLADMGRGVPDLLVGWRGANLLFEVKDGAKRTSAWRLTPDEKQWQQRWCGQVTVVENVEQAVAALRDHGEAPPTRAFTAPVDGLVTALADFPRGSLGEVRYLCSPSTLPTRGS